MFQWQFVASFFWDGFFCVCVFAVQWIYAFVMIFCDILFEAMVLMSDEKYISLKQNTFIYSKLTNVLKLVLPMIYFSSFTN